ncbi:MAG TPA: prenyltransferase [Spirochaetota bacterium]|nr:prenyltransferase [Spirochaetota bacterium]
MNTKFKAWLKAGRLTSQSYIMLPLVLGQVYAFKLTANFSLTAAVILHTAGIALQLFIIFANELADYKVDKQNRTFTLFSGGSRVLVDKQLTKKEIKWGILITGLTALLLSLYLLCQYRLYLGPLFVLIAFLLLWAYSYSPLKLSYRGGGELLQTAGLGVVLPVWAFYIQSGRVSGFPWQILVITLPSQLACALTTALPDFPSDKEGGKRTGAVLMGPKAAAAIIILLQFASLIILNHFYLLTNLPLKIIFLTAAMALLILVFSRRYAGPGSRTINIFIFNSILITFLIMLFLILQPFYA